MKPRKAESCRTGTVRFCEERIRELDIDIPKYAADPNGLYPVGPISEKYWSGGTLHTTLRRKGRLVDTRNGKSARGAHIAEELTGLRNRLAKRVAMRKDHPVPPPEPMFWEPETPAEKHNTLLEIAVMALRQLTPEQRRQVYDEVGNQA